MYQAFTKRRGLATMGVLAASALVLAGCASEAETTGGTSTGGAASSDVVELNLATVNNPQMVDMESLKGEFEAQYPNKIGRASCRERVSFTV